MVQRARSRSEKLKSSSMQRVASAENVSHRAYRLIRMTITVLGLVVHCFRYYKLLARLLLRAMIEVRIGPSL